MTNLIPEEVPVCRGPLGFPRIQPEKDLADLPPCSPCADQNPDVFDFSGPWLCRPREDVPEQLAALPEIVPDLLLADSGENLIPDWPEEKKSKIKGGALIASLALHGAMLLLLLGFIHLSPPEVDFELAAGSTFLEFDMVQIAKLGGGEELAPGETASPEQVAEEESPPEPVTEPEPELEQLTRAEPAPDPEIVPMPDSDLKFKEEPEDKPKEAPKPQKMAKEQEKPKKAKPKPPKAIGNPEPGGKAGVGPGNVLGSVHGNSAVGGGGAGGKGNSGKVGWLVARRPEPRYPEGAKQAGEQGRVVITVTVNSAGKIGGASIAQSSGHSRLDQAALSAAKGIVFKPNKGGAPSCTVTVRVPYQFNIRR